MQKHLDSRAMRHLAEYEFSRYFVRLAPGYSYEDLFSPVFWSHHRAKLKECDLVRVVAQDGSFDVDLSVAALPKGGVLMEYRCGRPPVERMSDSEKAAYTQAEALRVSVVPIGTDGKPQARTQFTKATKWRVVGINGEEVQRDLNTEAEADAILTKYLGDLRMRQPTDDEIAAAVAARTKKDAEDTATRNKAKAPAKA